MAKLIRLIFYVISKIEGKVTFSSTKIAQLLFKWKIWSKIDLGRPEKRGASELPHPQPF